MIPPKPFLRLIDLEAALITAGKAQDWPAYQAALLRFEELADEVCWPWRASREQVEYWQEWKEREG